MHRVLAATLDGARPRPTMELRAIADECSITERRAAEAERELVEWKKVKFMAERVGDEFDALIISTASSASSSSWTSCSSKAWCPIETLPGDRYGYQENTRKIVGERTRREFSIGDQSGAPGPRGRRRAQAAVLARRTRRQAPPLRNAYLYY